MYLLPSLCWSAVLVLAFWLVTPARAENLWEAYSFARARDPLVTQARAQLEAERARWTQATAALLPRAGLEGGVNRTAQHSSGFGPESTTYYTGSSASVTLRQPLLNGQRWANLDSARTGVRAAEAGLLAAEQDLILRVAQAYFGILKAAADERVARGEVARLEKALAQAQAFREVGAGEIIAVKEAQARLDLARAALVSAESERHIAQEALYRLTRQPIASIHDLGPLTPEGPSPARLEPWLDSASRHQPLLRQAREHWTAARQRVTASRRGYWPSVDLSGGYYYSKGGYIASLQNQQWLVGLNVSMPLYDRAIVGQLRQAQAEADQVRARLDDLDDQIHQNTTTAFRRLQDSVARWQAVRVGREVGTRSTIDLLNAGQDLTRAQRDHNLALYEHVTARLQLKAAAGVLDEADVRSINGLLRAPGAAQTR